MKDRIVDFPQFVDVLPSVACLFNMSSRTCRLADIPNCEVKGGRLCMWCRKGDILNHHARRYCSDHCKISANMWTNPQSCQSKAYVMIERQACACALCGLSYEDQILRYIERKEEAVDSWSDGKAYLHGTGYHLSGMHEIDIDHIIPIHKGGIGLGLTNIQAVCRQCHREKTANERRK